MRRAMVTPVLASLGLLVTAFGGPLAARPVQAGERWVQSWVEVGSTKPAIGCQVDVSVEVRDGGYAVSGVEAMVALGIDGDIYAADRGITNDAGVAYLTIDTGAAYTSTHGWLDVLLGGTYLGGTKMNLTSDGPCAGASRVVDLDGVVSLADLTASAPVEDALTESESELITSFSTSNPISGTILSVPTYVQQRNLSCEFASLSIATGALGGWVSEYAFDDIVGWSANPHAGFRGDIGGWWGNTTDYGVYAEALAPALNYFGYSGEVFYGNGNPAALTSRLDQGLPTLVWLGFWGDTSFVEYGADGSAYKLAAGEHVVVAYGYDAGGVYVSDPAIGDYRYFSWDYFLSMWNVLDGMSLAVGPA